MPSGRTPLHYAALHGRAAAVEELIKQGAGHEAKDNRGGYTPLHLAADAGQCEVISRLCEMGADLEAVSTKGWTPLALANMKVGLLSGLAKRCKCAPLCKYTVCQTKWEDLPSLGLLHPPSHPHPCSDD